MKQKLHIIILLFVYGSFFAQEQKSSASKVLLPDEYPEEHLFLHVNEDLLFVGESLNYSLYCIEPKAKRTSQISKIAYVELISEQGNRVFSHKLRLEKGRAYGDFFINTDVSSGNYKLIAYTRWTRNCGEPCLFQFDLTIINPYTSDQSDLRYASHNPEERPDTLYASEKQTGISDGSLQNYGYNGLTLDISKKEYGPREKVLLNIKMDSNTLTESLVSISVRKIDSIGLIDKDIHPSPGKIREKNRKDLQPRYLPELRGELISGIILDKDSKPVENLSVALSIPGKNYQLQIANSKKDGSFYFNIDRPYSAAKGYVQILSDRPYSYKVSMMQPKKIDVSKLEFKKFKLSKNMENLILERSVHNQLENTFLSLKPDSLMPLLGELPFYREDAITYNLGDYTMFNTIRETFVEIITHAWIAKDQKGRTVFRVRGVPPYFESPFPALVIFNGVLIQNHEDIMDYDARKISKLHLGRKRYIIGGKVFHGFIDIETFDRDFDGYPVDGLAKQIDLRPPLPRKKYFNQAYSGSLSNKFKRIPDFRYQLLWLPDVVISDTDNEFGFYTSDLEGDFEITVKGFTSLGEPLFIRKAIKVE